MGLGWVCAQELGRLGPCTVECEKKKKEIPEFGPSPASLIRSMSAPRRSSSNWLRYPFKVLLTAPIIIYMKILNALKHNHSYDIHLTFHLHVQYNISLEFDVGKGN